MLGAISSMILIMILAAYGSFKAFYMFNRMNPNISRVSLLRDMSDGEIFKPQEFGFDFAFGIGSHLNESFGYYTVK